jgi:ribosomal protein S17E
MSSLKLSASERAKAAYRRELARQQEPYLVTLEEENTGKSTLTTSGSDQGGEVLANVGAALSVSGLSVDVLDEQGHFKSELVLKHITNSNLGLSGPYEKPMVASEDLKVSSERGVRPNPPTTEPLHTSSRPKPRKKKISSDLTNRYSPAVTGSKDFSPQNSRTLQELAELRAKKLSKFIQSHFTTMAERNAAVKAAEEAIYAQLVARNNKSAELANSYKRHPKRLEDALGMIDQIYLKLRQNEEEQRQKSREYMEGALHNHEYIETTPIMHEKSKFIPTQFRGAASIDPDKCSAVVGGGSIDHVDERSMEVTVPTLAEQIDSKAASVTAETVKSTFTVSVDALAAPAKSSEEIAVPDVSLYRNDENRGVVRTSEHAVEYSCQNSNATPKKLTISSTVPSEKVSSPLTSPSCDLNESSFESPYVDVSQLIEKQELESAVRRAEEMVRLMAQEVDWLAHSSGDESSLASSIDFDDDISTLSQYTRSSYRSMADGTSLVSASRSPLSQRKSVKPKTGDQKWIAYWSDEHQREYYYNPTSKEVVWQIPDEEENQGNKDLGLAARSLSYDDATVDECYIVPVKDFTRKPKNLNNEEKYNESADSLNPLQSDSPDFKVHHRNFIFACSILGAVFCCLWLDIFHFFGRPHSQILVPDILLKISGNEGHNREQISKRLFIDTNKNLFPSVDDFTEKASTVKVKSPTTSKSMDKSPITMSELQVNVEVGQKRFLGSIIHPGKEFYYMWSGTSAVNNVDKVKSEGIGDFILPEDEGLHEDLTIKPIIRSDNNGEESKAVLQKVFTTPWSRTSTVDNTDLEHHADKKGLVSITKTEVSEEKGITSLIITGKNIEKRRMHGNKNTNEGKIMPHLRRPKICFLPLSWLAFPSCRNLANVAPLFDVNSPEFMKYW